MALLDFSRSAGFSDFFIYFRGSLDFLKDFRGFLRIFGKVYEDFWSDTPLVQSHIKEASQKARRGIGIIKFLSKYVSRDVLDQIYKLYVRPHLDYGDIVYHKYDPQMHLNFTQRLERTQYCAALAVTGAWRGTSRERLYQELGWEDLYHRR